MYVQKTHSDYNPPTHALDLMNNSKVFRFFKPNPMSTLLQQLKSSAGAAVGWGLLAGTLAIFFVERIPNFRRDFFSKLPIIGDRYAEYRVVESSKDKEEEVSEE